MTAQIAVDVQIASDVASVPEKAEIAALLQEVIAGLVETGNLELTVRIVDEREGRKLNSRFRQIDRATNVLSFPADFDNPPDELPKLLGDVVVCGPVVEREAREQGKDIASHWTHLFVHGTLHLLGYDHRTDHEATTMESLEKHILAGKGIEDPYAARHE